LKGNTVQWGHQIFQEIAMRFRLALIPVFSALGLTLIFSGSAFADQNAAKTKDELIREGFTCSVVSVGFYECTKSGHRAWWCSGNNCEMAPRTTNPPPRNPGVTIPGNMTMSL
jgi:hypothetical protein